MRGTALAVPLALLLLAAPSASGQTAGDYLRLKDRYVDDPIAAVRALAGWPRSAVNEGMDLCLQTMSPSTGASMCTAQDRIAAAMMHTDLAVLLVDVDTDGAVFHVRTAARMLNREPADPQVVTRWYAFIAQMYLSRGRSGAAADSVAAGLEKYPDSSLLHVARGITIEHEAGSAFANLRGDLSLDDRGRATATLDRAAAAYRRALELDPDNRSARLRLGWARLLSGDRRAAGDFDAVLRSAPDSQTRYLAHLFLGAAAERERRGEDVSREYEAARRAGPQFQSACLASSQAEDSRARVDRADAIAAECLRLAENDNDPWWHSGLGLPDPGDLAWLHERARRP